MAILEIPELSIKTEIPFTNNKGTIIIDSSPVLWSPKNPKLYSVSLTVDEDTVTDNIGFREIKVEDMKIILNGEAIFLKGICVHEDHIDLGKSTDDDVIRETIADLKELNGVFLRLAHYPHSRRFAQIADEMGQ